MYTILTRTTRRSASITTKKGNTVTRKGTSDDPAVILDAGKSKVIKKAHELRWIAPELVMQNGVLSG